MGAAGVRASDPERERALAALRGHYEIGRLDEAELEERAARITQARFRDELRDVFADLPSEARRRGSRLAVRLDKAMLRGHTAIFAAFNVSLIGLWAMTGGGAFWPAWTLLPWAAVLAGHAYTSRLFRRFARRLERRRELTGG